MNVLINLPEKHTYILHYIYKCNIQLKMIFEHVNGFYCIFGKEKKKIHDTHTDTKLYLICSGHIRTCITSYTCHLVYMFNLLIVRICFVIYVNVNIVL